MDEDEEMWDDDEKVDEDGLEVTMATSINVGGSQNRRKQEGTLNQNEMLPTKIEATKNLSCQQKLKNIF